MPPSVIINQADLETLLICSMRYAMGRMSYITGQVADMIQDNWDSLRPGARALLRRDLSEALEQAESAGQWLGMQMDHVAWRRLLTWMDKKLAEG